MKKLHVFISVMVCRGWQMNSKAVKLEGKKHRYVVSAFGVLELSLFKYQQKHPSDTTRENKSEQWILMFIYLLIFYHIHRKGTPVTYLFDPVANFKKLDCKF